MLIKCPECGKEVSDSASTCIHCGYSLIPKKEEASKEIVTERNDGLVIATNVILGIFGLLMAYGVLRSKGGTEGNAGAAAISWFLVVAALCALFAIKKLSKVLSMIAGGLFIISIIICSRSIKIAPAYLLLELAICINVLLTIRFFKKNKVY